MIASVAGRNAVMFSHRERLSYSWSFLGQSDPLIPGVLAWEFCRRGRHVWWCKKFSSDKREKWPIAKRVISEGRAGRNIHGTQTRSTEGDLHDPP